MVEASIVTTFASRRDFGPNRGIDVLLMIISTSSNYQENTLVCTLVTNGGGVVGTKRLRARMNLGRGVV